MALRVNVTSRVVAICNQQAGVGKTTTTIRLGVALLERGRRVLLVDLDHEGSLTVACGIDPAGLSFTIYDVLCGKAAIEEIIMVEVLYKATGLDVAPANMDLAAAELELVNTIHREKVLRTILEPLRARYDYMFIDCPSSLGLLTLNAMVAADSLLIPVQREYPTLRGLDLLCQTCERMKRHNRGLTILGILPCLHDRRSLQAREVMRRMLELYPDWVMKPIRSSSRFAESSLAGSGILDHVTKLPGAEAYRRLAELIDHA